MADPMVEQSVARKMARRGGHHGGQPASLTTKARQVLIDNPAAVQRLRARGNNYDPQTGQDAMRNSQRQTIKALMNPGKMVK